ncbi:2-methoxy-6-polyprenyl-1,4-benzoquinol methylase, mitochondrial [subsurface metagenome]
MGVVRTLNGSGVPYALCGGMAVVLHGYPRLTRDIDLLIQPGDLSGARDALAGIGLWIFYKASENGDGRRFINSVKYLFESNSSYKTDLTRANEVLQAGRREMRRFFDSLASEWDQLKTGYTGRIDLDREIAGSMNRCDTAVDLGCGTGELLTRLSEKAETVIGVDSSPRMLEQARRRLSGNYEKIQLRIGDLEHLPLKNEEADYAVINLVLHHLPDPAAGIREARRVLKRHGNLIVLDFNKHRDESIRSRYGDRWLGFTQKEMETWLQGAGFQIKGKKDFPLKSNLSAALYVAEKI